MTPRRFRIRGGRRLRGVYPVQGNKNAALPLIAASLLVPTVVELHRVPDIVDVANLLRIIESIGVKVDRRGSTARIDSSGLAEGRLPFDQVERLRGSILLWGALAHRMSSIETAQPGGCPIGKRSFDAHFDVLRAAGFEILSPKERMVILRRKKVEHPHVVLEESSVTATENALILFAGNGGGVIHNPAREPHVLSLIDFLEQLGCRIERTPLSYRVESGPTPGLGPIEFHVPADYIDAGTAAIAAAVTGGEVELLGVGDAELLGFRTTLEKFGIDFHRSGEALVVSSGGPSLQNPERITAGLWPSFPTDLTSIAIVLATQSQGTCLVHDWMYESRMFFVDKLVRMGATITLCDPHRVLVEGPRSLRGITLESPDIRAGMAMLVAGLVARGETRIDYAGVVERGYERVVERLSALGADIELG